VDIIYDSSVDVIEKKKRALAAGDGTTTKQIEEGNDIIGILRDLFHISFSTSCY
jgi:hypothetical protein